MYVDHMHNFCINVFWTVYCLEPRNRLAMIGLDRQNKTS